MAQQPKTVFVLGAGFTRAFLPGAPLLTDDYYVDELIKKFENLAHAKRILLQEKRRKADGSIDIERLMTRLHGGMPYDYSHEANKEFDLLLKEVKRNFARRLEEAKSSERNERELKALAEYCISNTITCVTFNYDDILDQALWEFKEIEIPTPSLRLYWHPGGGYGFYCKPSGVCVIEAPTHHKDRSSIMLLKLHGSVNWRVRLGSKYPYIIDAIVHHQNWYPPVPHIFDIDRNIDYESIGHHLESEPFIVPAILIKSDLIDQPILRLVWSLAYEKLSEAKQVIFAGYSLPVTDLASSFLFSETLIKDSGHSRIKVVNLAKNEVEKQKTMECYRRVFPDMKDEDFDFRGVLEWSRELTQARADGVA